MSNEETTPTEQPRAQALARTMVNISRLIRGIHFSSLTRRALRGSGYDVSFLEKTLMVASG